MYSCDFTSQVASEYDFQYDYGYQFSGTVFGYNGESHSMVNCGFVEMKNYDSSNKL